MVLLALTYLSVALQLGPETDVDTRQAAQAYLQELSIAGLLPQTPVEYGGSRALPSGLGPQFGLSHLSFGNEAVYYGVVVGSTNPRQVTSFNLLSNGYAHFEPGPFATPDSTKVLKVARLLHRLSNTLGEDVAIHPLPDFPDRDEVHVVVFRRLQGANVGNGGVLVLDRRTGFVKLWKTGPTYAPPPDLAPRITVPEAFQIAAQAVFSRPELKAAGRILALPDEDYPSYRPVVCLPGSRGTPIPERYQALKEQGQSILAWELPLLAAAPEGGGRSMGSHWVGLIDAITGEVVSVGYMALGGKPEGVPAKPLDVRNFEAGRVTLNGRSANVEAFSLVSGASGKPPAATASVHYVGPRVAFSCEWDGADRLRIGSSEFTAPQVLVETLKKLAG